MSSDVAISVNNLSKCYQIYEKPQDRLLQMLSRGKKQYFREFWALKDISFEIKKGETFGIIGRNGSGKSTLLQILAGTLAQTSGAVIVNGRIAALLELGSGFNPDFTGKENVFLNGSILGLTKQDVASRYDQIVEFADIGEFIDQPVKTYSSGMFVRLAFAVQAHIDASIVIIDEALAVGDVFFRQKCYARLEQLRTSGAAILIVSHTMTDIEQYCKRAILIDHGEQKFLGLSGEAVKNYYLLHQSSSQYSATNLNNEHYKEVGLIEHQSFSGPPKELYLDVSRKKQIGEGKAKCTGIVLCDSTCRPCYSFKQGDEAIFFYEFQLSSGIEIPICGVVIKNDRGVIVHGKNSWQVGHSTPKALSYGNTILCRQKINLNLQPGEYTFDIALASIEDFWWQQREQVSHEEISSRFHRICCLPDAGVLTVGLASRNGLSVLTHHGIADLPGDIKISVSSRSIEKSIESALIFSSKNESNVKANNSFGTKQESTIFHITHWKSGSQWIYKILLALLSDRIIPPALHSAHFLNNPLVEGGIYPTLYVTREDFFSVALPLNSKHFVIVRDLRDTLISGYFSIRYSHKLVDKKLIDWRDRLSWLNLEDGLIMLFEEWLPSSAKIQKSWLDANENVVRYEDLLERDLEILAQILIEECRLPISLKDLERVVQENRFEQMTKGRRPGQESVFAHERKGIHGDWKNYFTPAIRLKFYQEYGNLLARLKYE